MPEPITATPTAPAAPPPAATQTAPAAQPTAGVSPAAAPAAAPWYGDITDPDLKGWAELKKPADATTALKGWRESEKLIGVPAGEVLRIPKADAKPEETTAFYRRLGLPETPEGYKLEVPMGDDGRFVKIIAPMLHKNHIVGDIAGLNRDWNALQGETIIEAARQQKAQSLADMLGLEREWGSAYAPRREMARRMLVDGAKAAGFSTEENNDELVKLENYIGNSAKLTKLFAMIAEKTKYGEEGRLVEGDGAARGFEGNMTPGAAKALKEERMSNPEWQARYKAGDKAALAELDNLQRIQNSGAKAGG
jgi:hypothetical protein